MVGDRRSAGGTGEGGLVLGSQRDNHCGSLCGEKEAGAMTVHGEAALGEALSKSGGLNRKAVSSHAPRGPQDLQVLSMTT